MLVFNHYEVDRTERKPGVPLLAFRTVNNEEVLEAEMFASVWTISFSTPYDFPELIKRGGNHLIPTGDGSHGSELSDGDNGYAKLPGPVALKRALDDSALDFVGFSCAFGDFDYLPAVDLVGLEGTYDGLMNREFLLHMLRNTGTTFLSTDAELLTNAVFGWRYEMIDLPRRDVSNRVKIEMEPGETIRLALGPKPLGEWGTH